MAGTPTYEELEQRIAGLETLEVERDEAKAMLERLFNLSIDMLCVASITDGHYKLTNKAFNKTLGYSNEELLSAPFLEFVHPDDRASTMGAVEKLSRGEPVVYFENRYCCKNGSYKWLAWASTPVSEEGLTYAVVRDITDRKKAEEELKKHRDHLEELVTERTNNLQKANEKLKTEITERKWAEEALRESEERFRSFMESATEGFSLWDSDLNLIMVNEAQARLFSQEAKKQEDVVGKNIIELSPRLEETGRYDQYRDVIKSGEPLFLSEVIPHPIFENRYLDIKAFKVGGGLGMIVEDITQRKRSAAKIREWKSRYETAVLASGHLLYDWNSETNEVVYGGDLERILGYSQEEMQGGLSRWIEFIHPEDQSYFNETIEHLTAANEPAHLEYRVRKKDGKYITVEDEGHFITDAQGNMVQMVGFVKDITERKQAEEDRERLINELQKALDNIKTLKGLLPICAKCKKIRDDKGYWNQIEAYIERHSDALFSHGLCPECMENIYGDEDWYKRRGKDK